MALMETTAVADCSATVSTTPVSLTMSVQTDDQRLRELTVPVMFFGTSWHDALVGNCAY